MAQLSNVRIDSHLIHGQVRNVWLKRFPSKIILLIDNPIASDPFLAQVHRMAAPVSIELRILSTDDAAKSWQKDRFGPIGPVFVVFGNIRTACEAYRKGFNYPELMVGCLKGTAGGGPVRNPLEMNEEEKSLLEELKVKGCKVELQELPVEYGY